MKTMKNSILNITATVLGALALTSCADSLERAPKTEITAKDFFKTASDLQIYTDGFYKAFISVPFDDTGSDNVAIYTYAHDMYTMVNSDGISASNVGGWSTDDWSGLRRINYMMDNIDRSGMDISDADLNHYLGIARFFRGRFYYDKVKRYSAVPLYLTAVDPGDEALYKASDSRTTVVDAVIEDLEFAAGNIKPALGQRTRISRYTALAFLARVALHEGTYRKYHPGLGLASSAAGFLHKAVDACEKIIASDNFAIYGSNAEGYRALFTSEKLRDNPEIIMAVEYDRSMGRGNNTHTVLGEYWGLTNSLMSDYQNSDGTPWVATHADGSRKSYVEMFEGRDPRFAETFAWPGFKISPEIASQAPYRPKITYGGMIQLKFYPRPTSQRSGWNMNYTSLPLFRYAETLLILAEAKAELGTITQSDLDRTVNLIRGRVGMPPVTLSGGVTDDIRRERRVELACEGLRLDDIKRWAKGDLIGAQPQGIYIDRPGAFDVTGDGVPDMAILPSPNDISAIASLPQDVKDALVIEYLADENGKPTTIYLENGESGYIRFTTSLNRSWQDKFYYTPVPDRQMQLNPNLVQPPGW